MRDHESEQVRVNAADEIQLIGGAIVPSIRCWFNNLRGCALRLPIVV